jgi:hypothetical protein
MPFFQESKFLTLIYLHKLRTRQASSSGRKKKYAIQPSKGTKISTKNQMTPIKELCERFFASSPINKATIKATINGTKIKNNTINSGTPMPNIVIPPTNIFKFLFSLLNSRSRGKILLARSILEGRVPVTRASLSPSLSCRNSLRSRASAPAPLHGTGSAARSIRIV